MSNSGSEFTFNAYTYQDIVRVIVTDPMASTAQISANMIPVVLTWTAGNCLFAIGQWTCFSSQASSYVSSLPVTNGVARDSPGDQMTLSDVQ